MGFHNVTIYVAVNIQTLEKSYVLNYVQLHLQLGLFYPFTIMVITKSISLLCHFCNILK